MASKLAEKQEEARSVHAPLPYFFLVAPSGEPRRVPYAENIANGLLYEKDGEVLIRPGARRKGWKFADEDDRITAEELERWAQFQRRLDNVKIPQASDRPSQDVIPKGWRKWIPSKEDREARDAVENPDAKKLREQLVEVQTMRRELEAELSKLRAASEEKPKQEAKPDTKPTVRKGSTTKPEAKAAGG